MIFYTKRYKYNSETLKFEEVKSTPWKKMIRLLGHFAYLNFLALTILAVIYSFIDSPEVLIQKARIEKHNEKYLLLAEKVDSLSQVLQQQHFLADQSYRNILELDSLPQNIRFAGTGGANPYAEQQIGIAGRVYSDLMVKIKNLNDQVRIQDESYNEILKVAIEKNRKLAHFPGITPIKLDRYIWISSYFGARSDPFTHHRRAHLGIDFVGPRNTNIYATAKGTVTLVKHSRRGYGNEIVIDHGYGYSTRYAHLNKILVEEGQKVTRGEMIGLMGNTGRSTGTHLHYEVRLHNRPVNPIYFFADDLKPEEFEQLTTQKTN